MKFGEYVNRLVEDGYKKGAILTQIARMCGLKSTRSVQYWLSGDSVPDVYRAQMTAAYLSKKFNRRITVTDLWPVDNLKEVV